MNILLIEDDYLMRTGLGLILLEWGYSVTGAKNGEEALQNIKENKTIDLIICDIFMPELSGPGFLLKLKQIYPKNFPKVLVMSAVKNPDEFLKKLEVKYDVFLSKPIDFMHLKNVLANLLGANSKA
ncbi:MAG: response regulator [Bacteroidota bacterium]